MCRDLQVRQTAMDLVLESYKLAALFPKKRDLRVAESVAFEEQAGWHLKPGALHLTRPALGT